MNPPTEPHLIRRFGLLQATALNITNMIGIGPFITIPIIMGTINGGGPQCMLGWIASLLIVLPDGLIWAELGAAMPTSGGSYFWLREGFGRETWGRLMGSCSSGNSSSAGRWRLALGSSVSNNIWVSCSATSPRRK